MRESKAKKVLQNGHHKLSTYGFGMEWSKNQWVQLSRLLMRENILEKSPETGSLLLTPKARKVLSGEETVRGILDRSQVSGGGEESRRTTTEGENKHNDYLFEDEREKRKELADEQDIAPRVLYPDTTL